MKKTTYEKLTKDPSKARKSQLCSYPHQASKNLFPGCIARQKSINLEPIVDYTGSIGYATSRSVADILVSLTGKTEHHVFNSQQLASIHAKLVVEEGEIFNPTMWFHFSPTWSRWDPQHHQEKAWKWPKPQETYPPNSRWSQGTPQISLHTTFFVFRGQIYRQCFGTAIMGSLRNPPWNSWNRKRLPPHP